MKIVILSLRNIFDSYLARPHVWPRTTRTQQPYHPIRPDGGKRILTPDKQTPPPFHHPPQQGLPLRRKRKKGKLSPITSDYIGTSTLPTIMDPQQIRHATKPIHHPPQQGSPLRKERKKGNYYQWHMTTRYNCTADYQIMQENSPTIISSSRNR